MKRKYYNFSFFLIFFSFSLLMNDICSAQNIVTKKISISAFGMDWKNSEEAKLHLLSMAKRDAVGELFGEYIRSTTEVKNFVLTNDEIQSIGAGFIRISGNPEFENGNGFGEVCVEINAYVTQEDLSRLKPRKVQKRVCIADPQLSLGEIRQISERQARIQAVRDFEPKLEQVDDDIVLGLIHEAKTEDVGFVSNTTTFCATAVGYVYPIELMTLSQKPSAPKESQPSTSKESQPAASKESPERETTIFNHSDFTMKIISAKIDNRKIKLVIEYVNNEEVIQTAALYRGKRGAKNIKWNYVIDNLGQKHSFKSGTVLLDSNSYPPGVPVILEISFGDVEKEISNVFLGIYWAYKSKKGKNNVNVAFNNVPVLM